METDNSIESQIAAVLSDIHQMGYSSAQPFSIGKVEERMLLFAQANAVTLSSDELYMSAKQLQHCMRASKATKGLVVSDIDLINFPQNRFQMDLYYDGECFIYTDGQSKFIVHPNNPFFQAIDGVLYTRKGYDRDGKRKYNWLELIAYPSGKGMTYKVPVGVTRLENQCFKYTSISHIELPNTLKEIGKNVFYGCTNLKVLVVPPSVIKDEGSSNCSTFFKTI